MGKCGVLAVLLGVLAGCGGAGADLPLSPAGVEVQLSGPQQSEGPADFVARVTRGGTAVPGAEVVFGFQGDGASVAPTRVATDASGASRTTLQPAHTGTLVATFQDPASGGIASSLPATIHGLTFVFDEPKGDLLNFRRMDGPFVHPGDAPRTGLDTLLASGSAQPNGPGMTAVWDQVAPRPLTVVDLRRESHGFLNGQAVSWYADRDIMNLGLSLPQVEQDEQERLARVAGGATATVFLVKKKVEDVITEATATPVAVAEVREETDFLASRSIDSFRSPNRDHYAPEDPQVDAFVAFVRDLEPGRWLHLHCHGGDGRTTTYLAMLDMMRNAPEVSVEDIMKRQYLLGGIDLATLPEPPSWKRAPAAERLEFLRAFHRYCLEEGPGFQRPWSEWRNR